MSELFHWLASAFSTPLGAVAQVVGFVPLALALLNFLPRERKHIITIKTAADLLWAVHFFLLGEFVGGAINSLNTVRNLVFSQKHSEKC